MTAGVPHQVSPEKTKEMEAANTEMDTNIVQFKPRQAVDIGSLLTTLDSYQPAEGEEYMCRRQKKYFLELLTLWLERINEEGQRTAASLKRGISDLADENDRASNEEQLALNLRWHEREFRLLHKLKDTISRIDHDEFGFCDACGVEIGLERLLVRPTATLCIDCKQIEEIKERQGVKA